MLLLFIRNMSENGARLNKFKNKGKDATVSFYFQSNSVNYSKNYNNKDYINV